jgi:GNAT superfamily N-acetyltransferase
MSDVAIGPASLDDVRAVLGRRKTDDTGFKIGLESVDQGLAWVARDQSEAVGLVLARDGDDERFIGELFVEPSYRGQGIGGKLLDASVADAGDAARAMVLDPSDYAGMALALRRGISPQMTVVRVAGAIPREDNLMAMAAGDYRFGVDTIDPTAHAFGLNALDRETRGTMRLGDHESFANNATGHAFFLNGEFVAYAYVSAAYLAQIFAFALVTLRRTLGVSWCTALIPTSNGRVARAALRAGLQIEESLTLATDATTPRDLSRYAGFHRLLF